MNKTITRLAFALIIVTCYFAPEVQACSCGPEESPYRTFQDARAVFIGKVIGSRDVPIIGKTRGMTYTVRTHLSVLH